MDFTRAPSCQEIEPATHFSAKNARTFYLVSPGAKHMDKNHLDRYLAEFDFRMNTRTKLGITDTQRAAMAVQGFKGKRSTYRGPGEKAVEAT
jgi:hypothetical protein